jgi:ribosomal protein S12 methylthiotransferase accessory factor
MALSNAVTQGKGLSLDEAAISALMEAIETWAAERLSPDCSRLGTAEVIDPRVVGLFGAWAVDAASSNAWASASMPWIDGWDLMSRAAVPVPLALVDTVYTVPSPHLRTFPRTTTGLAAGSTFRQAVIHASLEILERHAVAEAHRIPHFFDRWQIDAASIRTGRSSEILTRLARSGLLAGIWRVPAPHDLPVYWCHIMEDEDQAELVPLPAEGFGCDFTHDGALAKALLEACQARLTAISGAREDVTRRAYPRNHDRAHLAEWRRQLRTPSYSLNMPVPLGGQIRYDPLERVVTGIAHAGASAAIVVPLYSNEQMAIHVARVVAPPLHHGASAS